MMDFLYNLDITLFVAVNQHWTSPVLDAVMPFLTDLNHMLAFRIVLLLLVVYALWKDGARGRWAVLTLLVAVTISDQVNSFMFKEWIARQRPCHELADVRLLVDCGGGKSFPSSHAVNAATIAVVVGYFYPRALSALAFLAFLVAWSRVYVGVHYPFDVVGGGALGVVWGLGVTAVVPGVRGRWNAAVAKWSGRFRRT